MKYVEVKIEDNKSVLVDESVRGEEGYNYNYALSRIDKLPKYYLKHSTEWSFCAKIIASINHSIDLDVPMIIVENEVEKLADNFVIKYGKRSLEKDAILAAGFINGFKAAQEIGTHSDEAIKKAIEFGVEVECGDSKYDYKSGLTSEDWYIKSLKQKYIELEREHDDTVPYPKTIIKTTRDSIGQLIAYLKQ